MGTYIKLDMDEKGKLVDQTKYRCMIGFLLYLIASRPDITYSVCLCARFQVCPKESHLNVVKRIFRYLKDTIDIGLWYPKCDNFEFICYSDWTLEVVRLIEKTLVKHVTFYVTHLCLSIARNKIWLLCQRQKSNT